MKVTIRHATSIFCVYLCSVQPAKVHFSLCFIKHEAMKAYEGVEVSEPYIFNFLDGR
jgi:hypothetical protein